MMLITKTINILIPIKWSTIENRTTLYKLSKNIICKEYFATICKQYILLGNLFEIQYKITIKDNAKITFVGKMLSISNKKIR